MTTISKSAARRESGERRAPQYVGYYRVSSPIQGNSGLSLEGQGAAVRRFVEERDGKLVAEFSEVRSGLKSAGMQLREALRNCRMRRAILVVASIDRLSRRLTLITAVMDSDIELAVVDSPNASRVVLQIKGAWAQHKSECMSQRIKAALAEAKKRGVNLGGRRPIEDMRAMARLGHRAWRKRMMARAMEIAPLAWRLRAEGRSLADPTELNWRNLPTPQGRRWRRPACNGCCAGPKANFRRWPRPPRPSRTGASRARRSAPKRSSHWSGELR